VVVVFGTVVVVVPGTVVVVVGGTVVVEVGGTVVVAVGGGAARPTKKCPIDVELPSRATRPNATVRCTGEGLPPMVTWAAKVDVQGRTLLA
jgi:hypothetical protein